MRVQGHEAMLLAGDRDGGDVARPAGLGKRIAEGGPPRLGIALPGTHLAGHQVGRPSEGHPTARLRIDEHDLRRLGRAVDAGHEPSAPFRHVLLGQLGMAPGDARS